MIWIADTGPLLHLHWISVQAWALPVGQVLVAETVANEARRHDEHALRDPWLVLVPDPTTTPNLAPWILDPGEVAALSLALALDNPRAAAQGPGIPVIGSIGLILRAYHEERTDRVTAKEGLNALTGPGRFHIRPAVLRAALEALDE